MADHPFVRPIISSLFLCSAIMAAITSKTSIQFRESICMIKCNKPKWSSWWAGHLYQYHHHLFYALLHSFSYTPTQDSPIELIYSNPHTLFSSAFCLFVFRLPSVILLNVSFCFVFSQSCCCGCCCCCWCWCCRRCCRCPMLTPTDRPIQLNSHQLIPTHIFLHTHTHTYSLPLPYTCQHQYVTHTHTHTHTHTSISVIRIFASLLFFSSPLSLRSSIVSEYVFFNFTCWFEFTSAVWGGFALLHTTRLDTVGFIWLRGLFFSPTSPA